MFTPFVFWPWFAGLIFVIGGLLIFSRRVAEAPGIDKIVVLGPVFYAAPLAVFGAEHLAGAKFLMTMVPNWIPAHLFWTYFVGIALVCAAISIILMRYVTLSGLLLGLMFFLFVLLLHLPRAIANPGDRIAWTIVLREIGFAGGAFALAGRQTLGRFTIAATTIFFGVEHFLHPDHVPGVPLEKMMPPWIPLAPVWCYFTGAALVVTGIALLLRKKDRMAAAWTGSFITLLVLVVYAPMLAVASKPPEMTEAINYIFDTLLFAGTLLVMARALPHSSYRGYTTRVAA
jgi:uncharacterized membrane protein